MADGHQSHRFPGTPRSRLIHEALVAIRATQQVPGVTRIARIGSLTTAKSDPKDTDLLVTITDDMDLTPLATIGRKLQGRTTSFGQGGEIFLASSDGRYLGRTCPWTRCGFGIRLRCDAIHCGWCHYLHDDLETITLAPTLVATPPLEIWPRIVARVPPPDDIAHELIAPLVAEGRTRW